MFGRPAISCPAAPITRSDAAHQRCTDGDRPRQQFLRCGLAFSRNSVTSRAGAQDCLYWPPRRSRIYDFAAIDTGTVDVAICGSLRPRRAERAARRLHGEVLRKDERMATHLHRIGDRVQIERLRKTWMNSRFPRAPILVSRRRRNCRNRSLSARSCKGRAWSSAPGCSISAKYSSMKRLLRAAWRRACLSSYRESEARRSARDRTGFGGGRRGRQLLPLRLLK
jgi:hypothetical protein